MKRKVAHLLVILSSLAACVSPTSKPPVKDVPFNIPTNMLLTPQVYIYPTESPTETPFSVKGIKFLTEFSDKKEDWQVVPGNVTAAQINAEVAQQEGGQINRVEQKVINGFVLLIVRQEDGQVFEVLSPAELIDEKLTALKIKNVKQIPVLSKHAVLLERYFEINFPDTVEKWKLNGAADEDMEYTAVITLTWATKYGPLRISYKLSGKYISETGKYPGRLDFLRLCMYEQTQEHFLPNNRLGMNLYPMPIVGMSGTTLKGITGEMKSDAFGWTPMTDFAKAERETLNEIGQAVNGVVIESPEILAKLQAEFDKTFMPVHCAEAVIER